MNNYLTDKFYLLVQMVQLGKQSNRHRKMVFGWYLEVEVNRKLIPSADKSSFTVKTGVLLSAEIRALLGVQTTGKTVNIFIIAVSHL